MATKRDKLFQRFSSTLTAYRSNSSQSTDAVCDSHQRARVIRRQVEGIDLHSRIISAHETHRDCEQRDRHDAVTATKGSEHQENTSDRERKRCVQLSRVCDSDVVLVDAPVTDDTENHCADPHRNVRQGRVKSVVFDLVLENVRHVLGQVSYDGEVPDSMTDLRNHPESCLQTFSEHFQA